MILFSVYFAKRINRPWSNYATVPPAKGPSVLGKGQEMSRKKLTVPGSLLNTVGLFVGVLWRETTMESKVNPLVVGR